MNDGQLPAPPRKQRRARNILAVAAAEVSIGLALVLWLYHWHKTVDIDKASSMRG